MVCYTIPSIFLFSSIFQLKTILLGENLVIKALTNLMAHFIFFAPNKLEPLCRLCCICLHLYVGERTCGPPCVVLVINDNLYGLMCVLSYTCRICPLASLEACDGFKDDEMQRRYVVQAQYARSMMRN